MCLKVYVLEYAATNNVAEPMPIEEKLKNRSIIESLFSSDYMLKIIGSFG